MTVGRSTNLHGTSVTAENIGSSSTNCCGDGTSEAYRADVTTIVESYGDGPYVFTTLAPSSDFQGNGVLLVVLLDDSNNSNNHDVVIFDGNDSNVASPFDSEGWTATLANIKCPAVCTSGLEFHVSDCQLFLDDAVLINGNTLVPSGHVFDGDSVPPNPPVSDGNLWDIHSWDITSFLTPSVTNTLTLTSGLTNDCLSLHVAIVTLPPGAPPGLELSFGSGSGVVKACVGKVSNTEVAV